MENLGENKGEGPTSTWEGLVLNLPFNRWRSIETCKKSYKLKVIVFGDHIKIQ